MSSGSNFWSKNIVFSNGDGYNTSHDLPENWLVQPQNRRLLSSTSHHCFTYLYPASTRVHPILKNHTNTARDLHQHHQVTPLFVSNCHVLLHMYVWSHKTSSCSLAPRFLGSRLPLACNILDLSHATISDTRLIEAHSILTPALAPVVGSGQNSCQESRYKWSEIISMTIAGETHKPCMVAPSYQSYDVGQFSFTYTCVGRVYKNWVYKHIG